MPPNAPSTPTSARPPNSAHASDLRPHAGLFALLSAATFFEGFDTKLAAVVQPRLATEFSATPDELGLALGLSSVGMVFAFFLLHLADWIGRRPVFLGALLGYAALTLATTLAPTLAIYTGLQALARMAMVTELSLAYLILSEEIPPEYRGRANGFLGAFAALGAALPVALLAPLEAAGWGWRGLFVVGALPLLLFPVSFVFLRETRAFRERREQAPFDLRHEWKLAQDLFARKRWPRLAGVTSLWFVVNFWAGAAMGFLTLYTFGERGWEAGDLVWLPLGTIPTGLAGYLLCGFAMDKLGRRQAATLYLVAAAVVTGVLYQTHENAVIYVAWALLVGLNGIWTILTTWTLELFPTRLRATAMGVCANLLGRTGMVVGPIAAGALSAAWGSTGNALTALAAINLVCLPIIWGVLPETRGIDLRSTDLVEPAAADLNPSASGP